MAALYLWHRLMILASMCWVIPKNWVKPLWGSGWVERSQNAFNKWRCEVSDIYGCCREILSRQN